MSTEYWNMKLGNSYVKYNDTFHRITNITCSSKKRANFPEDLLPHMKFTLESGKEVKFEDFEIVFPDDQTFMSAGKSKYVRRNMSRHYKIAPTSEVYRLSAGEMRRFLVFNEDPEYAHPEEAFLFDGVDRIFSKNISKVSGKTKSTGSSDILYCGRRVATVKRSKDSVVMRKLHKKVPAEVDLMFQEYFDEPIPYAAPEPEKPASILMEHAPTLTQFNNRRDEFIYFYSGGYYRFNFPRIEEHNGLLLNESFIAQIARGDTSEALALYTHDFINEVELNTIFEIMGVQPA